jgi:hypothetical protein
METALASLVGVEATGAFSLGCGGDGLFGFDGESLCQLFVVHLGEVTEVLGVFSGQARQGIATSIQDGALLAILRLLHVASAVQRSSPLPTWLTGRLMPSALPGSFQSGRCRSGWSIVAMWIFDLEGFELCVER